jgi:hypothetical protein
MKKLIQKPINKSTSSNLETMLSSFRVEGIHITREKAEKIAAKVATELKKKKRS